MPSMRAWLALAMVSLGSPACHWPRAQLLVSIESDLDYGTDRRLQFVNVTVRSGSPSGEVRLQRSFPVAPDASNGRVALPFSFGVYARNNDAERAVWIEALACGADACAASAPIAVARLQRTFERDRTVDVTLRLAANCDGIACPDLATTCDPDRAVCAPANATDMPAPSVTALAAGGGTTCALHADHSVRCWGGLQTTVADLEFPGLDGDTSSSPRAVSGVEGLASISVGVGHACGIRASDHAVLCWGSNAHGQLGNGNTDPSRGVVTVATTTPVVEVSAGRAHTCARHEDGTVNCWGRLLDPDHPGSLHDVVVPARVEGLDHVVEISTGETFDCARIDDGTIRCWGSNTLGQLGAGDSRLRLDAVTVVGVANAMSISVGSTHACARIAGSTIRCWGANDFGALGNGTTARSPVSAEVVDLANVSQVVAAGSHTCARTGDGRVWCWGRNDRGQLGDGTTTPRQRPARIEALTDVIEIRAGIEHTCALRRDGSTSCWGSDTAGQLGNARQMVRPAPGPVSIAHVQSLAGGSAQVCAVTENNTACWGLVNAGSNLGVSGIDQRGTRTSFSTPTPVDGLPASIQRVSMGATSTCVLFADGSVSCWGDNSHGQLGDDSLIPHASPAPVRNLAGAAEIASGDDFVCALLGDGTVACWGGAGSSAVGSPSDLQRCGDTSCVTHPVPILGLADVMHIAASGHHACALLADQTVRCWGDNSSGQCGSNDLGPQPAPVRVNLEGVTQIALNNDTSCALLSNRTVRCWGSNASGELGHQNDVIPSTYCNRHECSVTPVEIPLGQGVHAIDLACGSRHSCVRTDDEYVFCWGANELLQSVPEHQDGSCATGSCTQLPYEVPAGRHAVQLALGTLHTCVRFADGHLRCWGNAAFGQFGDPGAPPNTQQPAPGMRAPGFDVTTLHDASDVVSYARGTCVLSSDDRLACAGDNARGQLGNGNPGNPRVATMAHLSHVIDVAMNDGTTCALRDDGSVWCWGFNGGGLLGTEPSLERATEPRRVPDVFDAVQIAAGAIHACARLRDGHVICWGDNSVGQLGDGTADFRTAPVLVAALDHVVEIRAGLAHTCARRDDGSVLCWGLNLFGQLGTGSTVDTLGAVQVQRLGPVDQLAAGQFHTCARVGGRVYCWGQGDVGQLGDGALHGTAQPAPSSDRPVAGLADAISIRAASMTTCAERSDGSSVCWGGNAYGLLGDGTEERPSPSPVTVITPGIRQITGGSTVSCGLDANGMSVYCWGANDRDQLGNPAAPLASTAPVRVIGVTNPTRVEVGFSGACAIQSESDGDHTLHCWGENSAGAFGDGTITSVLSFTPVVGLNRVTDVSAGFALGCASIEGGTVRCWGSSPYGQLGYAASAVERATDVNGLENVTEVASGAAHNCARLRDGTVRCWGANDEGQLGVEPSLGRVPALGVAGLSDVTEITGGGSHTCAIRTGGAAWCWGANDEGQLGRSTSGDCSSWTLDGRPTEPTHNCAPAPAAVDSLGAVSHVVAGGRHTCAIDGTGHVLCWGANSRGQLGRGAGPSSAMPGMVQGLSDVVQLSLSRRMRCDFASETAPQCAPTGGDHSCARRSNGEVWCWGANDRGQLGDGTREDRSVPVRVPDLSAVAVIAGGNFTCAAFDDGTAQCWGDASEGTLGDGAMVFATEPRVVR